jgi:hypothetical protein
VGRVVVAVTRLVVAVGEDSQMALRMCRGQFRFRASIVERLAAGIDLEILLFRAAKAFAARVTLAAIVMSYSIVRIVKDGQASYDLTLRVALVFVLVLVLFIAAIALGMMRLGLACTTTVLALLDGATLRVDVMQIPVSMVATAHSVTLDAGRASPFFTIDNRHAGAVTAECGRRSWLRQLNASGSQEANRLKMK